MNNGIGISISMKAARGDTFSLAIMAVGSYGFINSHRVLCFSIGTDGSLYLTMMKIGGNDKEWGVSKVPAYENCLKFFNVLQGDINTLGLAVTPKFSFHPSGIINIGKHRTYRPPLRTISNLEQLCLLQYGAPTELPLIDIEEANLWKEEKGHPLIPMGVPLPGGILATRVFVSGPNNFDELNNIVCSDFKMVQMNLIFHIRGLSDDFPEYEPGIHGYDLIFSTGILCNENWNGPSIIIPAINPTNDPEACRIKGTVTNRNDNLS